MSESTELHLDLSNDSGIPIPVSEARVRDLIHAVETGEGVRFAMVELVYVDEAEIEELNKGTFGRDYVTDIISFHYHDDGVTDALEGSLVMCAPRIREQALEFGVDETAEFERVIVHGLLHVIGFDDSTPEDKAAMTHKEDSYLA